MSSARRLCDGGYFDLERPLSHEDDAWNLLCSATWNYQWVRSPADFSLEIADALYEVSQGVSGIMLSVFAAAQLAAMEEDGKETVDADLIRKVYRERMRPLHPAIRLLQSGDPRQIDKFDDLYWNEYPTPGRCEDVTSAGQQPDKTANSVGSVSPPTTNASGRKPQSSSGRRVRQKPVVNPKLTEEQINKIIRADAVSDITSVLDSL
jgi:hypothetical protein